MGSRLPTTLLRRPSALPQAPITAPPSSKTATPTSIYAPAATAFSCRQQLRHATYVLRPRRPYQFTQLVQLSDGSTFTVRTTSPAPLYRSSKDTRNHLLWQPSEKSLRNVEVDDAGKLAAFRARFGHGWDLAAPSAEEDEEGGQQVVAESKATTRDKKAEKAEEVATPPPEEDSLADLISGYAAKMPPQNFGSQGGGRKKK
ncbi:hypothetical protein VTK73DRAFT_5126 [Phialemonium thermophilum]|uniref:Ribosomal protein bL31m N-terminal domain-containing protein n=1 Tax=Phialemonium thermophilum TaxID=223376 RepID=A0ABR3V378_9PEZI